MFQSVRTYRRTGDDFSATVPCTYIAAFYPKRCYIGKMLIGKAYISGQKSRQVKSAKNLTVDRNGFTKPCCLEPCTGFTDGRDPARFREKPHVPGKSMPCICEECIDCGISSGFWRDRIFHQTAKPICKSVHCFAVLITRI